MPNARNGDFEVLNFTSLVELVPRTEKLIKSLGLFGDATFGESTIAQVERVTESNDAIDAKPRGGDRNFAGRETAITRNLDIPLFPLDSKFEAKEIQDLKAFGTTDISMTMNDRVSRTLGRIERSHSNMLSTAMYTALKGTSYSPGWTQGQVNYYTLFGQTPVLAPVDFTDATIDPGTTIEADARASIIDNALDNADSYRVIALCGRQWFSALIDHELVREAFASYKSEAEPLRKRLSGDSNNRYFEYKGVLYIEDYSGEIATGDAYIMPLGISDMFKVFYAPADHPDFVNTTAQEMYVWMVSDNHRTRVLETETSLLCAVTRPELIIKSTGTFV